MKAARNSLGANNEADNCINIHKHRDNHTNINTHMSGNSSRYGGSMSAANATLIPIKHQDIPFSTYTARILLLLRWYCWSPPVLWQGVIKPVWSATLCGENTMLHAECCEKGVHRWVPRRCTAPGPIARSAEHANEVIMLCLTLCFCLSFTVWAFCLSQEAGHPCDAANHRCHIWHNEETQERSWDGDEVLLCFSS